MRKISIAVLAIVAGIIAAPAASAGVGGPAFYVDGVVYRTVGTPSDFSGTGAPAHSYDTIYAIDDADQALNVAEAAPGDGDFNGGRWQVKVVHYENGLTYQDLLDKYDANDSDSFDSAEEIEAAEMAGDVSFTDGPTFECPVIPLPRGRN